MLVIGGAIFVVLCVIGGYMALGGKLAVLYQPFELVIIGGAGLGAYIIANPPQVLKSTGAGFSAMLKGSKYKKDDFIELLSMQYQVYRLAKTKGMLALEAHVENPAESDLFSQFPRFAANHHAVEFFCDYLRLLTLGTDNPHELEALMDEELETHHHEQMAVAHALQTMGDAFPALGIVAAVLGVIKTMGSITEPPEVLGKLIGGALVGTFLGIFLSYGWVGPMAAALGAVREAEHKYFVCMRTGLLAHLQGYAPAVSVEFARKALLSHVRPTFYEVEEAVQNLPQA
ncbi:MAG: flagellar motor stator protein MotA [Alphaproteobacteria bacterium]|nr:flagellar motor stator protein MotA [Alphaproteobacteria bacterium]